MAKQATANATLTSKVVFLNWINGSIVFPFRSPATLLSSVCGSGRGEEPSGEDVLRLIQDPLATPSVAKILPTCQTHSQQARIADSNSRNAVSFTSARTTKRFPSPRSASATKIVLPLELIVDTQPPHSIPPRRYCPPLFAKTLP